MKGKSWTVSFDSMNIISLTLQMKKQGSRDGKWLCVQVVEGVKDPLSVRSFFKA